MKDDDLKQLSFDFSEAVLRAAARKTDLTQDDINIIRKIIIQEFTDLIGPMLP